MGLLDTVMLADAKSLMDTDEFGESVTITPHGSSAITRTVVIVRDPIAILRMTENSGAPGVNAPKMLALVANDSTTGRTTWKVGLDTITVAFRYGGTAEAHTVAAVIRQDAGMWVLDLR